MIEVLTHGYAVTIEREIGQTTFIDVVFFNDWESAHNYLWRNK